MSRTEMSHVAAFPPAEAVIVAEPAERPRTKPVVDTLATDTDDDDHVIGTAAMIALSGTFATAVNCNVCPAATTVPFPVTSTAATRTGAGSVPLSDPPQETTPSQMAAPRTMQRRLLEKCVRMGHCHGQVPCVPPTVSEIDAEQGNSTGRILEYLPLHLRDRCRDKTVMISPYLQPPASGSGYGLKAAGSFPRRC